MKVAGPFGTFCTGMVPSKSIVMIAGGVGITPFLSVLRHYRRHPAGGMKFILFWGNGAPEHFFSLYEIDSLHFFMDCKAVIVSERPFQFKHIRKHRISSLIFEEGLLTADMMKKYVDFREADFYVCGSNAMQEFVHRQLDQSGVERERIRTEIFGR